MTAPRTIGRYAIHGEIAAGGMATVHFGRLLGPVGFTRPVAIKQLHPQYARDPEFVAMFLDEARIAARIQHPNVVSTLDVVQEQGELLLVMEYVAGESLARLLREVRARHHTVPTRIAAAIAVGVLHGLQAAHDAKDASGAPLEVVHRDVSPQNVLVGADGVPRLLDFGVAKAIGRSHSTGAGHVKGKLAYMAPEQLSGKVSPRTDVFAASIVLWETLTTRRLFVGDHEGEIIQSVKQLEIPRPSDVVPELLATAALDEIVLRGLERDVDRRWPSARDMALAIETQVPLATPSEVAAWVRDLAGDVLQARAERLAELESDARLSPAAAVVPRAPDLETSPLHAAEIPANETQSAPRKWLVPAIAAAIGVAIGAASLAMMRAAERPATAVKIESAPTPSTTVASTPPAPTASLSVTTAPPPPASASTRPSVVSTAKKPHVAPKPNCDPPYVREGGKLVPKPGCL